MVFSPVFISHHPGRTMPQAAPLRNLSARRLPRLPRLCREASRGLGRGVRPPSLYSPVSLLESALTKRWGVGGTGHPGLHFGLRRNVVDFRHRRCSYKRSSSISFPCHIQDPLGCFAVRSAAFLFFLVTRHSPLATHHSLFSHVLAPVPLPRLRWAYCSCTLNLCWRKKIFSAKPTQHSIISRGACSLSATNTVSTSKARLEKSKSSSRNPRKPNS